MALQSQRTEEPTSRLQSLEFFLSSIRDPHNPRHCAVCLDGAFRECTDAEKWKPGLQKLKNKTNGVSKYNPELWNAIVKFLFIKRTNKQMERFLTRLGECTCRLDQQDGDVQRYHQSGAQTPQSEFRVYINHFEDEADERHKKFFQPWRQFLFNVFINLSVPIERSTSKSSAKGSATSWPHGSTDLIPDGADALVASILRWYEFIPDPVFFSLMGSVLQLSRELVIPSLVKYRFTEKVIETTKQLVDHIMMTYGSYGSDLDPNPKPMTTMIYVFPWQMSDALHYLTMSLFTVFHDDYKAALFQDCEVKATQICSLLLYILYPLQNCKGFPQGVVKQTIIGRLAQDLFRFFHMHLPSRPSIPVHPVVKQLDRDLFPPHPAQSTPRQIVLKALRVFRVEMRCSARGCSKSLHTVGNEFQRCGKCGIVGYCGRDCQRKAWKDEDHPHKRLCPVFVSLVEKTGGYPLFLASTRGREDSPAVSQAMETIRSNWSQAQIDADDLKLVTDWQKAVNESRGCTPLAEKELKPGFMDYDDTIFTLSLADRAPRPVYLDRTITIAY